MRRKVVPYKIRAVLQKEVGSVCPFCQSTDVGHFEVHHIDGIPANNQLSNLIMLCPTCHSKIEKGDIVKEEVIKIKRKISGETKPKLPQKVKELIEKGTEIRNESRLNEAGEIYFQALELSEKLNDEFAIAQSKLKIAGILNDKNEYPEEALNYIHTVEKYFRENNLENELASALYESSVSELKIDKFDEARIHLKEAVAIYIKLKDTFHEATCYFQMGWMEHGQGHLSKSKELYYKAIDLLESDYSKEEKKLITARIGACYAHLALVNKTEINIPDTETNLLKALDYFKQAELKISIGQTLFFLAELKLKTNNLDVGQDYLNEAGKIFSEIKEARWLAQTLDLSSKVQYTFGDKKKAVEIFIRAIAVIEQTNDVKNKLKYYGKLAELYKVEKNYSDAEKMNLKIMELAETEKDDDEYYHAVLGMVDIKKAEGKTKERNEFGKKGIEKLKQFLVTAQREAKRAYLLGNIASLYTECENYFEAKKYFSLAKDAFITLSDKVGISNCLGALAYIYQLEGNHKLEMQTYSELKELTEGSHNYFAHAAAIFNLCMNEIQNNNFELARKYFSEAEYLNYNYGLNLEEKLEQLELILSKATDSYAKPERSINELFEDFYSEVNFYPDERIHHLRFWIFFHGNELFSNFRYLDGLKFLIVSNDTEKFLNLNSQLIGIGELFLQSFNTKQETGKAILFHYPKKRLIPKGISLWASKDKISREDVIQGKVSFSKKTKEEYEEERENNFTLKRSHISKVGNYTIFLIKEASRKEFEKAISEFRDLHLKLKHKANLILAYPVIFPKPFEELLLNSTPQEILKRKIFFDISDRADYKDKFYSDLNVSMQLNLIPIYFGKLPTSERVITIETIKLDFPVMNEQLVNQCNSELSKIKNLLIKFSKNINSSKSSLQSLKIEIQEISEHLQVPKIKLECSVLELLSYEDKEKILAIVIEE
jgi:hypothetical protein